MTIYDRIRELRNKKGWSMDELAQKVGYLGRSAISKVENGERLINHEMLIKYAQIFGVSPMYLLFGNIDNDDTARTNFKNVPVLEKISNGDLIFAKEEHNAVLDVEADFCFTARDNSMAAARIKQGDIVFIKDDKDIKNGEIVAVAIDGDYTLRYWYYYPEQKKLVLNSTQPEHEPLIYSGSEIKKVLCLGKVVCFMSKISEV